MTHYYTDNRDLPSCKSEFTYYFDNEVFHFTTDNGVFSKGGVDYGSYLLIKNIYKLSLGKRILDLGCGYGPIGIILGRFHPDAAIDMVDVNSRAVDLSVLNCQLNKVFNQVSLCEDILSLENTFDSIVFNPPIRAGKTVIYDLYHRAYEKLSPLGSLYIVVQKKQGALSHIKELESVFAKVSVLDKDGGYFIIQAIKTGLLHI